MLSLTILCPKNLVLFQFFYVYQLGNKHQCCWRNYIIFLIVQQSLFFITFALWYFFGMRILGNHNLVSAVSSGWILAYIPPMWTSVIFKIAGILGQPTMVYQLPHWYVLTPHTWFCTYTLQVPLCIGRFTLWRTWRRRSRCLHNIYN